VIEVEAHDFSFIVNSGTWALQKSSMAAHGLITLIQDLGPTVRGIEVGVCTGINSYMLLESCPNITEIVGVDHYKAYMDWQGMVPQEQQDGNYQLFMHNLKYMEQRFRLIRKSSTEAAADLEDGAYDFVFIDADHSMRAVLTDLDNYYPKLRPGGIMAGHDIGMYSVGMAVNAWCRKRGIDLNSIHMIANTAFYWIKPS
jgi:predicted O-methyltransferase YrrM